MRRLGDDPVFHDEVVRDPRAKLTGYGLNLEELTELARLVAPATEALPVLDQRRSKAGFFALLSLADHGFGGASAPAAAVPAEPTTGS